MNHRNRIPLLALCAALSGAACSQGEKPSPVTSTADHQTQPARVPVKSAPLEQLTVASRDCLQYPVETRPDGTEIWNADYFYFSLFDRETKKPYVGSDGKPAGQSLLASQAMAFMEAHPELESRTAWAVQLGRQVQEVKGGQATLRPDIEWIETYDMNDLLAKDAAARKK